MFEIVSGIAIIIFNEIGLKIWIIFVLQPQLCISPTNDFVVILLLAWRRKMFFIVKVK